MQVKKKYKIDRPFEKVGANLKTAREALDLSQRAVSIKLGYSSAQFISNFERGIVLPPVKKLKALAKIYGLDAAAFADIYADAERVRVLQGLGIAKA